MIYLENDFYSNFSSMVESNDDVSLNGMFVDQISNLIAFKKPDLISLFGKIGIKVSNNPTNKELSNTIAKNLKTNKKLQIGIAYLIAENNKNYYHFKRSQDIDSIDLERNIVNEKIRMDLIEEKKDYIDIFVNVMEKNLPLFFSKQRDIQVADSILYLFKTRDNIENYNKKAIYILVRERTGVNSQYITSVINKIKAIYTKMYMEYQNGVNIEKMSWYEIQHIINN